MNDDGNSQPSFNNAPGAGEHVRWLNDLSRERQAGPAFSCSRQINTDARPATLCVHSGTYEDPNTGAVGSPLFATTTFRFCEDAFDSFLDGFIRDIPIYSRYGNPNQWTVQLKIAALEKAQSALVLASGMAAITTTLLALTNRNGHIISSYDLYGGSYSLLRSDMHQFGRTVSYVDPLDISSVEQAIQPETQAVFLESLSNPLMKAIDLPAIASICKRHDVLLIIDNTFLSPISCQPLQHGADIVIHSGTKYLSGHSDQTCGSVAGSRKLVDRVWAQLLKFGAMLDPAQCHLLERSLKTLAIRMKAHQEGAKRITEFLSRHPQVKKVHSPYLEGDDNHRLMAYAQNLSTGILSFEVEGGNTAALQLLNHLTLITPATSLGGVESLVSLPFNTSHSGLTTYQQEQIGLNLGLVRLSVGIEDPEDLCQDLQYALTQIRRDSEI
ncbi:trans-sulfuration enzyme family protein [Aliamphritea hakodatensis]|uniref:trans-sulfuration enzyme family protein n=1 Tax=Aliamphritea hakodatensis TaxID=2895352 RepID=UPI0022FD9586|nr:aminotransferase class I/II-fold pyridoxal phosphate-dependent enzyme [Aliamphritea hakodatensis]